MKLPQAAAAIITKEKICDYLLNHEHPDNGGKAAFFRALGFDAKDWQSLAASLREIIQTTDVAKSLVSPHGIKYIVDGPLQGSHGVARSVRTIWIIDHGQEAPRLVTAYPWDN